MMRKYSAEFKENAVVLSYQRENIKQLAEDLGLMLKGFINGAQSRETTAIAVLTSLHLALSFA